MSTRFSNLQICIDLARIPLKLPLFSKTSLVTPHVHSVEHLFERPYAVRDCPENPPASYIYKCNQPLKRSVKTRRKSLVSNKVYLQIAGSTRGRDGLTIQGLGTCTCCITKVRGEEKRKPEIFMEKGKNKKKEFIYRVAVPLAVPQMANKVL
jgi:hypothetical protein